MTNAQTHYVEALAYRTLGELSVLHVVQRRDGYLHCLDFDVASIGMPALEVQIRHAMDDALDGRVLPHAPVEKWAGLDRSQMITNRPFSHLGRRLAMFIHREPEA